jgi:hypothetical protein
MANALVGFWVVVSPFLMASSLGISEGLPYRPIIFLPKRTLPEDDLRAGLPELAMPDESVRMAGGWLGPDQGPDIVAPGLQVQASGEISKG